MADNTIVMCIKSEDACCILGTCPLYKQCFPEAYKRQQKQVGKSQAKR